MPNDIATKIASTFTAKVNVQGRIMIPYLARQGLSIQEGETILVTVRKIKEKSQ